MEWKNTISFLLVFLIAFALGYLIDVPQEIKIKFDVNDNALKMTESMKNLTYNCPACQCECISKAVWDNSFQIWSNNTVYTKEEGKH